MQALVEDLLTLAKADSQALARVQSELDVEDVLDTEVRRLRSVTTLAITTDIDAARVIGDQGRLTQVVRNLLDNAVRHAQTSIRVGTRRTGGVVTITIDNDGDPVARTTVSGSSSASSASSRAASATEAGTVSGWRSAVIVALHGGRVFAEATDDGWCRFTVELPSPEW